jgi:periplasmic divalent cation tolerance protein
VSSAADRRIVIVLTTLGADADAITLAETLVGERLAACVNILPVMTSVYRWKAQIERDREQQLLIKTTAEQLPGLEARMRALHPYEVPEFLVVSVENASAAYRDWLLDSVE